MASEKPKKPTVQSYKPVFLTKSIQPQTAPAAAQNVPSHSNRRSSFLPPAVTHPTSGVPPAEAAAPSVVQTKQQSKPNRAKRIATYPVNAIPALNPTPVTPVKPVEQPTTSVRPKEAIKHVVQCGCRNDQRIQPLPISQPILPPTPVKKEEKVPQRHKVKPLLPPAIAPSLSKPSEPLPPAQPQSQPQSQPQPLDATSVTEHALASAEQVLSSLQTKEERIDEITAEDFFTTPGVAGVSGVSEGVPSGVPSGVSEGATEGAPDMNEGGVIEDAAETVEEESVMEPMPEETEVPEPPPAMPPAMPPVSEPTVPEPAPLAPPPEVASLPTLPAARKTNRKTNRRPMAQYAPLPMPMPTPSPLQPTTPSPLQPTTPSLPTITPTTPSPLQPTTPTPFSPQPFSPLSPLSAEEDEHGVYTPTAFSSTGDFVIAKPGCIVMCYRLAPVTPSQPLNACLDEDQRQLYASFPGPLTKGNKKDKVLQFIDYQYDNCTRTPPPSHLAPSDEWKLLWGVLRIHVDANGVIGADRRCASSFSVTHSKATTEKLCRLFMSTSSNTSDLPPNELPNPDPLTYASDLISIQDMLLEGKVRFPRLFDV